MRDKTGDMNAGADQAMSPRDEDARGPTDNVLPPHALRVGMRTILLVPLFSAASLVLARRTEVEMGSFGPAFVAVAVTAGLATVVPYERLFRMGWATRVVFAWSVVNLALMTIGIWATGGSHSPLLFLYALTTLFAAVAFTPRAQTAFFALTVVSYCAGVGVALVNPVTIVVLAVLAFLASLLVGKLKDQTVAHREARLESERRWSLLAVVSAAARQMSAVEPLVVLRAVVDAVVALGFPMTRIYVQEGAGYRAVLPPDAGDDVSEGIDSIGFEAIEHLFRGKRPVVMGMDADALREPLRRLGLASLVAVPIPVADRVEAILVVGVEEASEPSREDVEVFQMLATQAAVALENAHRFERQRRSMDRIAELDRMKNDFLSNISHELRTPLTVITGVGRTLEESWNISPDDRRDLLARLNANAATLDSIVAELLDFGRLEAGEFQIQPADVDLRTLLDGVTDRLASLFRDRTVGVRVEQGLTAHADPMLIERVVENLLTNAAKYTPPTSHIRVTAISEGWDVIVAVEDDGPGIPADELGHIGERFFRGGDSNTRSTRGTGLGLALVSEILDLHGTYLEVESKLGIGSRFSFQLPRSRGVAGERSGEGGTVVPGTGPEQAVQPVVVSDGGIPERFETVLAAAQAGLEWAVAALFREFHPRVLRYLRANLPERANQLASETWSDIASGLPVFEGDESSFRRWVFGAARRHLQEARLESRAPGRGQTNDGRRSEISAERVAVDAALARIRTLAPEQADVLLLRALGDLEVVEVAELTGETPDFVRETEIEGLKHLTSRTSRRRGKTAGLAQTAASWTSR
jgi:signal transduction histidine kinase/DNA-directed RNA polymerase specialized sigma24 family protein